MTKDQKERLRLGRLYRGEARELLVSARRLGEETLVEEAFEK